MQATTQRKFAYAVVIGRFQPVHFGHQRLIEKCAPPSASSWWSVPIGNPGQRPQPLHPRRARTHGPRPPARQRADARERGGERLRPTTTSLDRVHPVRGRPPDRAGRGRPASTRIALVGHLKDLEQLLPAALPWAWSSWRMRPPTAFTPPTCGSSTSTPSAAARSWPRRCLTATAEFLRQFAGTADYVAVRGARLPGRLPRALMAQPAASSRRSTPRRRRIA